MDEITGQVTGIGDFRRALVQAGAAGIGVLIALALSTVDYRSPGQDMAGARDLYLGGWCCPPW